MGANLTTGGEQLFADDKEHEETSEIQAKKTSDGRYYNPFKTFQGRTFMDLLKWQKEHFYRNKAGDPWSSDKELLDKNLPIVKTDRDKLCSPPSNDVQLMWIGHASLLVQFDGLTILTDPVWSDKCGPIDFLSYERYRGTPYTIKELPEIDAILISHNHYDHLDVNSVKMLVEEFDEVTWFVADGQKEWMKKLNCKNVNELTWWSEDQLEKNGKSFKFACTPAQHWCKRSPFDTNQALWCSWVVKGPSKSFYFAGDTGYCCAFKQIGHKYGPFSLAAIPIGAYEPRWLMQPQHCNPEEAVTIHEDLKAERSVGVHWGTFYLSSEPYMEPKEKIAKIVKDKEMKENTFFTLKHGEVYRLASS